jgi:hypothetical protein
MNRYNLKILITKRLIMFGFCQIFVIQGFGQAKFDCDSLLYFLGQRNNHGDRFDEIAEILPGLDLETCVLDEKNYAKINDELIHNLYSLIHHCKDKKRIPMLMIELNPRLNDGLQHSNNQLLVIYASRSNLGDDEVLNKIKQNFKLETYYRLFFGFKKKLSNDQKKEVEQVFYNQEIAEGHTSIVESKKWLAALLLANENHPDAENYLLETVQTAISKIKKKYDRSLIYEYGRDLAYAKNNRLINYIVDEFLMGNYEWQSWDTGYSDFEAGREILSKVIDTPIFAETIMLEEKVQRQHIRKWFKEHRDNYTFKP